MSSCKDRRIISVSTSPPVIPFRPCFGFADITSLSAGTGKIAPHQRSPLSKSGYGHQTPIITCSCGANQLGTSKPDVTGRTISTTQDLDGHHFQYVVPFHADIIASGMLMASAPLRRLQSRLKSIRRWSKTSNPLAILEPELRVYSGLDVSTRQDWFHL